MVLCKHQFLTLKFNIFYDIGGSSINRTLQLGSAQSFSLPPHSVCQVLVSSQAIVIVLNTYCEDNSNCQCALTKRPFCSQLQANHLFLYSPKNKAKGEVPLSRVKLQILQNPIKPFKIPRLSYGCQPQLFRSSFGCSTCKRTTSLFIFLQTLEIIFHYSCFSTFIINLGVFFPSLERIYLLECTLSNRLSYLKCNSIHNNVLQV